VKKIAFIVLLLFTSFFVFATHERAAEITYRKLSNSSLEYEIKLVTYTYTPSPADRPQLEIVWGDGTSSMVQRTLKVNLPGNVTRNEYVTTHIFPGDGSYKISMEDPNRNYGVINIPNSVNIPIYVETLLVISPFVNPKNSSPVLLNPPLDMGCVGVPFIHNPIAYDPDGDSISYKLVKCRGTQGLEIPGYSFPQASNSVSINPITGDFIWDSPIIQGEYNIAILIEEWRNGVRIGYVTRDMQIIITACNNNPPVINQINDTCINAGDTLSINVSAYDQDGDIVTISASGSPFIVANSPATFPTTSSGTTVSSQLNWITNCEHVRKLPYQITFKAQDNGSPIKLTSYKNLFITIVAKAPENFAASPSGNSIKLSWNKTNCSNAKGYKIYRRIGYYGYVHGMCETGVPQYTGYSLIATIPNINDTSFTDNNNGPGLIHGIDYCYMIISYFSDGAESYASNEVCAFLKRDVPIITNVSIVNTDIILGSDSISWSKPTEFDTNQAPGPYRYIIYQSSDFYGNSLNPIDSLNGLDDTIYFSQNLNTVTNPYSYRIDLYNVQPSNRFKIGSTHIASSIFLTLTPADRKMKLQWNMTTPWINNTYIIYRKNNTTNNFDSIGSTANTYFTDYFLENDTTYCYFIKSIGGYNIPNIIHPIINFSQKACAKPIDTEPPCPPSINVIPDCQSGYNTVNWQFADSCITGIAYINIWYSPNLNKDLQIIHTINNYNIDKYIHINTSSIAGCYAVNAIDSNNNIGSLSNVVCIDVDSCFYYTLPNFFSPNNDGKNDFFRPFPYRFINKIDLKIFNRWGRIVFETNNPDINWDGKEMNTGKDCADGVYFFTCKVYEQRLIGEVERIIKGSITIMR